MTLNIEMEYETPLDFDYEELAKKVTEAALDYENCPYEAVSYTHLDVYKRQSSQSAERTDCCGSRGKYSFCREAAGNRRGIPSLRKSKRKDCTQRNFADPP